MNNYYAARKGQHNYKTNYDSDIDNARDEDFKVQTQVEQLVDPYEYQHDRPNGLSSLSGSLSYDKDSYEVHNYDQVVDQIYN